MIVKQQISLLVGTILLANSPCLAFQSGSRSAGPVGGFTSPATPPQPVLSLPQAFPQQPSPIPVQPSLQQWQSSVGIVTPEGHALAPYSTPLTNTVGTVSPANPNAHTLSQAPNQASSNTSATIPSSSLVDTVFSINDPYSNFTVDHSAWDCLLSRYMVTDAVGINRLRYAAVTPQDRGALKGYLQYLQSVDTRTLNRNEQLAFWFNLYNARTVEIVLENYPIRSIRQVKQKLTDFVGPFDDPGAVTVLGKSLSLNDIESGIVRPVWQDPRIHYGLNCASYGCPNLAPRAWTAVNLDAQLNRAASDYINSNRAVRRGLLGVRVSKIFKWYKDDFGGSDETLLNHLRQYANPTTLQKLQGQRILGYFYDWSLNDGRITRQRLLEPLIR